MAIKDMEDRMDKLEKNQEKLEKNQNELKDFSNKSIGGIQVDIAEIKTMLKERLEQEKLKNNLLEKDIQNHEQRIKKMEDNQQWLWRTTIGSIISIVIAAIVFVIKIMN